VKAGAVTTDSGSLTEVSYSPVARYEREARRRPPPRGALAAAYASCFTMTFAGLLAAAGHAASLRSEARVQLVKRNGSWEIRQSASIARPASAASPRASSWRSRTPRESAGRSRAPCGGDHADRQPRPAPGREWQFLMEMDREDAPLPAHEPADHAPAP